MVIKYATPKPSIDLWAFVLAGKRNLSRKEYIEWTHVARTLFKNMNYEEVVSCCVTEMGTYIILLNKEDVPEEIKDKTRNRIYFEANDQGIMFIPIFLDTNIKSSIFLYETSHAATNYLNKMHPSYGENRNIAKMCLGLEDTGMVVRKIIRNDNDLPQHLKKFHSPCFFERSDKTPQDFKTSEYNEDIYVYSIDGDKRRGFIKYSDLMESMLVIDDNQEYSQHKLLSEMHSDTNPGDAEHGAFIFRNITADKWDQRKPGENQEIAFLVYDDYTYKWGNIPTKYSLFSDPFVRLYSSSGYPHEQSHPNDHPGFYYGTNENGDKGFWSIADIDCDKVVGRVYTPDNPSDFSQCFCVGTTQIDGLSVIRGIGSDTITGSFVVRFDCIVSSYLYELPDLSMLDLRSIYGIVEYCPEGHDCVTRTLTITDYHISILNNPNGNKASLVVWGTYEFDGTPSGIDFTARIDIYLDIGCNSP